MALKTKISKADYDALNDILKTEYVQDGEGYKLDADYEDVEGLKAKRDELLGKLTETQKAMKQFEGLDPEAAKAALAKLNELEDGNLLKKQQFDELFAKKKGEWETEKASLTKKISDIIEKQAEQQLAMKLTENGVKPTMAEDLALSLKTKYLSYVEDNGSPVWKTKDGLETVDLDKYIPSLKESKADYFNSTLGGGSGSSGSNGNSGGTAKTWNRSQWDAASDMDRTAFSQAGGQVRD